MMTTIRTVLARVLAPGLTEAACRRDPVAEGIREALDGLEAALAELRCEPC